MVWWHEGWLCSKVTPCICTGTGLKWGDFFLLSTPEVQDSTCCLPCWSALSLGLQLLQDLLRGPSEGCGNLFPVFNPRVSGGGVVEEAVLSSGTARINGDKRCTLQCYSKHCLSLSCSWAAWEDWQMFHGRVDRHFLEFSLTHAGNAIRLSPMFCASALISTLLSVEEKSQEQHQKKFPLASKWVLPGGRKNIFLPLTYNEREETNQSFAMKSYNFYSPGFIQLPCMTISNITPGCPSIVLQWFSLRSWTLQTLLCKIPLWSWRLAAVVILISRLISLGYGSPCRGRQWFSLVKHLMWSKTGNISPSVPYS